MNLKNSQTRYPHRLSLNLSDKKTENEVINLLLYEILEKQ